VVEVNEEIKEIKISKGKLVLLSKLLKDLKNLCVDVKGKELEGYRYKTQRQLIEVIFDDERLNQFIDSLNRKLKKELLKQQVRQEIQNEE
jgi:hypothetical protein